MQERTSKNTSVNKNRLPSIYNYYKFGRGDRVFDYGCGKYPEIIKERMEENGCEWYGYDKYNKVGGLEELLKGVDICICANVLNVIDDLEVIKNIISEIINHSKIALFQIYEGDGSGIGKETKDDCWQRNEKCKSYLSIIEGMGYSAEMKKNFIFVK